jgi:hypothetical protein
MGREGFAMVTTTHFSALIVYLVQRDARIAANLLPGNVAIVTMDTMRSRDSASNVTKIEKSVPGPQAQTAGHQIVVTNVAGTATTPNV